MVWTATLDKLERENGKWSVNITYSDGTESYGKGYTFERISKKQLRDLARAEAARLLATKTTDIDIPIGTTIDVTPDPVIPPPDPTPAEIAKRAWFADWKQLKQLTELTTAVPALATAQATTLMTTLRASLKADWLNSYLGNI